MSGRAILVIGLLLLIVVSQFSDGGGGITVLPSTDPTAVVYVHEQRQTPVPPAVMSGLNRLNVERKIVATIFDKDSKNGDGKTPEQYVKPLAAANESGLPSLVVMAGDTVRRVVKDPKTEEQVMEAAK